MIPTISPHSNIFKWHQSPVTLENPKDTGDDLLLDDPYWDDPQLTPKLVGTGMTRVIY